MGRWQPLSFRLRTSLRDGPVEPEQRPQRVSPLDASCAGDFLWVGQDEAVVRAPHITIPPQVKPRLYHRRME